jgi:hypothetical protein
MRQEITFQMQQPARAMDLQFVRRSLNAALRAQAHALEIEASAKRRLADEYDAA